MILGPLVIENNREIIWLLKIMMTLEGSSIPFYNVIDTFGVYPSTLKRLIDRENRK